MTTYTPEDGMSEASSTSSPEPHSDDSLLPNKIRVRLAVFFIHICYLACDTIQAEVEHALTSKEFLPFSYCNSYPIDTTPNPGLRIHNSEVLSRPLSAHDSEIIKNAVVEKTSEGTPEGQNIWEVDGSLVSLYNCIPAHTFLLISIIGIR